MTHLGLKYFQDDRHTNITSLAIMESFKYWNSDKVNNDISSAFHLVLFGLEKTKNKGTKLVDEIDKPEKLIDFGVPDYKIRDLTFEQGGYFTFGV